MNSIKPPVSIEKEIGSLGEWGVKDSDNVILCRTGSSEYLAKEISLALNCHDALVDAVKHYTEIRDEVGDIARTTLAKMKI